MPRTGRPTGTGARYLRWKAPTGQGRGSRASGQLQIGRGLWAALGEPARLDVQRMGERLVLIPCPEGVGWSCSPGKGRMPRLRIGAAAADALNLQEGLYPADARAGTIVTTGLPIPGL